MDMQKPSPWGSSSSINPGPWAAVECKTPGVARGGMLVLGIDSCKTEVKGHLLAKLSPLFGQRWQWFWT